MVTLAGKSKELPVDWKPYINEYYIKKIKVYSSITEEYEKAKLQSKRLCKLSTFPSIDQWTPPTRTLSPYEQSLLLGPSLTVNIVKAAKVRMANTNQMVMYSGANYDRSSRINSSYVCINPGNEHPKFGRILNLYQHSFGEHTCVISEISLFPASVYNDEVNMWYVPQEVTDKTVLHFITTVSPPLIVSIESDETGSSIWFLNYTVAS